MPLMLDTFGLTPEAIQLLTPVGDSTAHDLRVARIQQLRMVGGDAQFTQRDAIVETYIGTQFDGENHRRLTPFLQQYLASDRAGFMLSIDQRCTRDASELYNGYYGTSYDVIIVGTGPHGAAVAANVRAIKPNATIMMIEAGTQCGGQFRSYGPKPAFMMNSRVRRANRMLPAEPRTKGSINPVGTYAPLELSDLGVGNYAMNTDMGDVCAINAFISSNYVVTGGKVVAITNRTATGGDYGTVTVEFGIGSGRQTLLNGRVIIDATGIGQQSALEAAYGYRGFSNFDLTRQSGRYFDTAALYRHFANSSTPLEAFANKSVMVIGGGDSALTALEALLGNLPSATYGALGVGRHQPERIDWLGSPVVSAGSANRCLRSRYKNGIVQALPKAENDEGALIWPSKKKALTVDLAGRGLTVGVARTKARYPIVDAMETDIVIDCTNKPASVFRENWEPDFKVGPGSGQPLPFGKRRLVESLGVKENTASLWATMEGTDNTSRTIGYSLDRLQAAA